MPIREEYLQSSLVEDDSLGICEPSHQIKCAKSPYYTNVSMHPLPLAFIFIYWWFLTSQGECELLQVLKDVMYNPKKLWITWFLIWKHKKKIYMVLT